MSLRAAGWARAVIAAVLVSAAIPRAPSMARPLGVEDLLQREGLGQAFVAPGGRWLVVELRGAYASAARFDFDAYNDLFRTRIMVADLAQAARLRPLFAPEPGAGYRVGPVSPDGQRVVVYRLTDRTWRLGVVTLATGDVRWLDLTPDVSSSGRTVQWWSPTRLLVIARPPGDLPRTLRASRPQAALPARWAASAKGEASVTAVGSGRALDIRPRGGPKRLALVEAVTGADETLAAGDFTDLELSPDGQRVALLEAGEDIRLVSNQPVQGDYGLAMQRQRLVLLDLRTRRLARPCPAEDLLAYLLAWSPAGRQVLVFGRRDGASWRDARLLRVEAGTGRVRAAPGDVTPALETRPDVVRAGWWGEDPIVFGRRASGPVDRDDWYRLGPEGPVALTRAFHSPPMDGLVVGSDDLRLVADGAAWRVDRAGDAQQLDPRRASPLLRRLQGVPDRTMLAPQPGGAFSAILGEGPERAIVIWRGRTATARRVGPADVIAQDGRAGALILRGPRTGRQDLAWLSDGPTAVTLATLNLRFADIDIPRAIAVPHPGPNGEALRSWLLLPTIRRAGGPPPLVVVPYLGESWANSPVPRFFGGGPYSPPAVLTGAGYAVLIPSLPTLKGGDGPSDGLAARLLSILDAAAAQPDLAQAFDPQRLGLWGHSFGGYSTMAIITQTGRFKAAIAGAGMSDLVSMWGTFNPGRRVHADEGLATAWSAGWTETLQGDMDGPPWAQADRYRRNSPVMQADRITTPLLLFHGEQDTFPLGQAEEMFSALFRQDKDAQLVTYWGESHVPASPGNLRDLYARGLAWLDLYLVAPGATAPRPARPPPGFASSGPTPPGTPPAPDRAHRRAK